jgi:hypothetical protein
MPRAGFVALLHRRPRGWDVLVYEMSVALADAYWSVRPSLRPGPLRVAADDLPAVSTMLARGFEVVFRQILRDNADVAAAVDAGAIPQLLAEEVAARVGRGGFDPILRKFAEDVDDEILPRPDPDLSRLVARLESVVVNTLATRAAPGGDLHAALSAPLSEAPEGFIDNGLPVDPRQSTGRASGDIVTLAPTVHEDDAYAEVKRKLLNFVRFDPWLAQECYAYVLDRVDSAPEGADEEYEAFEATDDFLHRATRVAGRTPIELFLERQPDMPGRQRQRLLRWNDENFSGVFHIRRIERPFLVALDVRTDTEHRLLVTREQALAKMRRGDLFTSRVVPWDDHWVLSGIQQHVGNVDERGFAEAKEILHRSPSSRRVDPNDPKIRKAFEIQAEQHRAWLAMFGTDELAFDTGDELQAAMTRFYRHWNTELPDPATGMTRAEAFERRHNRPAPEIADHLPQEIREAHDIGVMFDPFHGMVFLSGFESFRSALTSEGRPTREQIQAVLDYLREPSVDYSVFLRARERYPARLEELLRLALRDGAFDLARDFEPLLWKYKGEAMRFPRRPDITLVD